MLKHIFDSYLTICFELTSSSLCRQAAVYLLYVQVYYTAMLSPLNANVQSIQHVTLLLPPPCR